MNYEKQKPLSQEEINEINGKENSFYRLGYLPTYANDNIHMQVVWGLPIKITRNEDSFWFGKESYNQCNKANYWVVYVKDTCEKSFKLETKQFKNVNKALNYAIREYKKWLKQKLQFLNNYRKEN